MSAATAFFPLLLGAHEQPLGVAVRMVDERIAQVGDPACAGRALDRRADQVVGTRRRRRDHDVDPSRRTIRIAAGIAVSSTSRSRRARAAGGRAGWRGARKRSRPAVRAAPRRLAPARPMNRVRCTTASVGSQSVVAVDPLRSVGRERKPAEELHGTAGLERYARRATLLGRRLLVPDENVTWNLTAIPAAIRIVRREGIDVVITTSPPGSNHLIGAAVKRATGARWVADLRDPLVDHPHRDTERLLVRAKEQGRTPSRRSSRIRPTRSSPSPMRSQTTCGRVRHAGRS